MSIFGFDFFGVKFKFLFYVNKICVFGVVYLGCRC